MCRFLVWNKAPRGGDFDEGDVIAVHEDDHVFSEEEELERWIASGRSRDKWKGHTWVIDSPEISVEEGRKYLEFEWRRAVRGDPEYDAPDEEDRKVLVSYRRRSLDFKTTDRAALTLTGGRTYTKVNLERDTLDKQPDYDTPVVERETAITRG